MTRGDAFFGNNFLFNETLFEQVRYIYGLFRGNHLTFRGFSSSTSALNLVAVTTPSMRQLRLDSSASNNLLRQTQSSRSQIDNSLHTPRPSCPQSSSSTDVIPLELGSTRSTPAVFSRICICQMAFSVPRNPSH